MSITLVRKRHLITKILDKVEAGTSYLPQKEVTRHDAHTAIVYANSNKHWLRDEFRRHTLKTDEEWAYIEDLYYAAREYLHSVYKLYYDVKYLKNGIKEREQTVLLKRRDFYYYLEYYIDEIEVEK